MCVPQYLNLTTSFAYPTHHHVIVETRLAARAGKQRRNQDEDHDEDDKQEKERRRQTVCARSTMRGQIAPTALPAASLLAHSRGTIRARRVLGKGRGIWGIDTERVEVFAATRWQVGTRNVFARATRRAALERRARAACSGLLHTRPPWSAVRAAARVCRAFRRPGLPICARSCSERFSRRRSG